MGKKVVELGWLAVFDQGRIWVWVGVLVVRVQVG